MHAELSTCNTQEVICKVGHKKDIFTSRLQLTAISHYTDFLSSKLPLIDLFA